MTGLRRWRAIARLLLVLPLLAGGSGVSASTGDAAWALLRDGGHVVLIRHARAPGTGDPPDFRLDDCATQRNLSPEGRAQARALGQAFADHDIPVQRVLSSRWCRCLETAELAFGRVEPFDALNSFFGNRAEGPAQTAEVAALIRDWPADAGNLVLVTHQVNITALTEIFPAAGEILILRADGGGEIAVVGRVMPAP